MLHVLQHPLAAHVITHLRDKTTKPATFRTLAYQISLLLAIEATRGLGTEDKAIETPLEPVTGKVMAQQPLVVRHLGGQVGVHHLAAGMHAGVGPTRAHHAHRRHPQHGRERRFERALHGAQLGLARPAVEPAPVVGEVDPEPHGRSS